MYARVTHIHIKPDKVEEAIRFYKTSVVPAAKAQKGFTGLLLLTDARTGHGMSITLWASDKDALANEESRYYQNQLIKFVPYYSEPPSREGFDVSLRV